MLSFEVLVKVAEFLVADLTLTTFFAFVSTTQSKRFEGLLLHFFEAYWHFRREDLGFSMARGPMPVKVFASSKASCTLRTCVVRRVLALALLQARFLVPNSASDLAKTFFAKSALFGHYRNNMGSLVGIFWGALLRIGERCLFYCSSGAGWGAIPILASFFEQFLPGG